MTPVIEVHHTEDGVWEAIERHVLASEDLDAIGYLDELPTREALVRVGGSLKKLTVYLEDDEDGWITWSEAYGLES